MQFRGDITGFGTGSGHRMVIGRWDESPFGSFADVMAEDADGLRTLFAPDDQVAAFVSETYQFDAVEIVPVEASRGPSTLTCRAGELDVRLGLGGPTALGRVLRLVPRRVATSPTWCALLDPIARVAVRGVRTKGSAGNGRREWYGATGQHEVTSLQATLAGRDLGSIADVWPPVNFGFSSTPRRPTSVSVTTTVELPSRA